MYYYVVNYKNINPFYNIKINKGNLAGVKVEMSLKKNLGLIYILLPYISPAKNRFGLVISILFGSSTYKVKLGNKKAVRFNSSQFEIMLNFLGVLTFSSTYSFKPENKIEIFLDLENKFIFTLDNFSLEERNLLELLFLGIKYGANFVMSEKINFNNYRDKTFNLIEVNGEKIIETPTGIKFYLNSIHPGNSIIETFLRNIHLINSHFDWNDKIVIDVGGECGDTALYFANLGATVYAFEPIKEYFDDMMRNIKLNNHLEKKIIPINAAIGKDGDLTFYQSDTGIIGGTSFVGNIHGKNVKLTNAKGYSLETAMKKFEINHVDLLKMDCKGCEFFLTTKALEKVDQVKIEYGRFSESHRLEDLLQILKNAKFEYVTYNEDPMHHQSVLKSTHIFGKK